ncbi:MAG: hypothetical protein QNJ12_04315 [Ilumatobacter sp.]|uniref:hypothetical protein n=1 Tax=Ilumatobacter sp. TaxID=1967498 RepID=UPI002630EC5F|nr:hypothetical protein [Ilumatobacter sp.]MDJ0767989.1 hypothetical protein [Ilumatobacter sp.]
MMLMIWAAIVGSFLASGALVVGATRSALDVAPPRPAQLNSSRPELRADGIVRRRVDVPSLVPGDSVGGCVEVARADGDDRPFDVRVHGSSSGGLTPDLRLTIHHGVDGGRCGEPGTLTAVFDGPLAELGTDFGDGSRGLAPARARTTVAYPFTVSLDPSTSNSQQGATAALELRWEVRPGPTTR